MTSIHLSHYPLGPHVRQWLGISEQEYQGDRQHEPTPEVVAQTQAIILQKALDVPISDPELLTEVVDELVSMDFCLLALKLIDCNPDQWDADDFRSSHTESIAAMIAGDLARAEHAARIAQRVAPQEPAPYVNVVKILLHDKRLHECEEWFDAGFAADPNYFELWELFYAYLEWSDRDSAADILSTAQTLHSWAGISMAAEISDQSNVHTKAQALEPYYQEGERSLDFIVEYTGALGTSGGYDKILAVIWEYETQNPQQLPWQLHHHRAQAYLALEQLEAFARECDRVIQHPQTPDQVRQQVLQQKQHPEQEVAHS